MKYLKSHPIRESNSEILDYIRDILSDFYEYDISFVGGDIAQRYKLHPYSDNLGSDDIFYLGIWPKSSGVSPIVITRDILEDLSTVNSYLFGEWGLRYQSSFYLTFDDIIWSEYNPLKSISKYKRASSWCG